MSAIVFHNPLESEAFRYALMLTAIESLGDYSIKKYAMTDIQEYIGVASVSYLGLVYTLQLALRGNGLGITNVLWNSMTNITNTAIGVSLGEEISNQQYLGIGLITVGIFLLDGK